MNADAIVKALKCCNVPSGRACSECPYHEVGAECRTKRNKDAVELILEFTEEIKKWQEAYDCADAACRELSSKCDELTEENEYLKQQNEIYAVLNKKLEDACESYAWQYGTAVSKELFLKKERANTVRDMREKLEDRIDRTLNVFDFSISECNAIRQVLRGVRNDIYQVANEILGEE